MINTESTLPCSGVYKKVEPNPKCWAYPNSHGSLTVAQAIEHSCNNFFYEVGYRMSLKDQGIANIGSDTADGDKTAQYYSSDLGTDTLKKYAIQFGLSDTSGIEIPEQSHRFQMNHPYLLQSDKVPITTLPVSLQDILQLLPIKELYMT